MNLALTLSLTLNINLDPCVQESTLPLILAVAASLAA